MTRSFPRTRQALLSQSQPSLSSEIACHRCPLLATGRILFHHVVQHLLDNAHGERLWLVKMVIDGVPAGYSVGIGYSVDKGFRRTRFIFF